MKKRILLFAGTILMTFSIASFDVLAESLEDAFAEEACIIEEELCDDGNESYGSQDISLQAEMEEDCAEIELQIESVTVEDDPGLTVVDMDEEGITAISDDTDFVWETVMPSTITTVNGVYYYEISSAEELAYIAETGGDWLGYNYILKNDIILNNVTLETDSDGNLLTDTSTLKEWTPISDFTGIFDGNGYSISGVYEDRDGAAGFLLSCTGSIYNLSIENSYIKGTDNVGGICATLTGIGSYLSNCSFSGVVVGDNNVGGLIGSNSCSYIYDCVNNADVFGTGDYVAGIVGNYYAYHIINCINNGNIKSSGNYVAGIAGSSSIYEVYESTNNGNISGNNYVAGICSCLEMGKLYECVNNGIVVGEQYVGGLSGYAFDGSGIYDGINIGKVTGNSYVGGILGYLDYCNVSTCYSVGLISGESYIGAFVGSSQSVWGHGIVSNCYYLIDGNESYPGFGNVSEDIDDVVEGKYTAFFPILISSEADASYSALGYRIEECSLELSQMSYTYDGTEKEPGVAVMKDSSELIEGTDYTVAYSSNINVGNAVVTVTGIGDYKGTLEKTYTISKANQTVTASVPSSSLEVDDAALITVSGQGTISYKSSNTSVATVDSRGVVTGVKVGTVTITVTAAGNDNYNSASTTISITVCKANQSIYATVAKSSLAAGNTTTITASGQGIITFKSSNTSVATVSDDGVITGVEAGTAIITVTTAGNSNYNSASTTISITVTKASQTVTASAAASSIVAGNTTTVTASGQGTITYSSSNTSVATVNSSGVVTGLKPGTVTITATAAGTNAYNSASNTVNITVTLGSGVISSLTNTSKGITVKWSKVTGATGYTVYRKTSSAKKYTKVKTVTSGSTVSYTDTAVKSKNGTTYLYKVVPYYGSTVSSGTAKTTVRLTGATLSSVKNSSSKKAAVKWKKTSKVSGYQIQYSTSKTFASGNKTTKVSGASKTSKTLTGLKKGKTYYVRIRTYKTVNGKTYYSAWSSKKSVKIKK